MVPQILFPDQKASLIHASPVHVFHKLLQIIPVLPYRPFALFAARQSFTVIVYGLFRNYSFILILSFFHGALRLVNYHSHILSKYKKKHSNTRSIRIFKYRFPFYIFPPEVLWNGKLSAVIHSIDTCCSRALIVHHIAQHCVCIFGPAVLGHIVAVIRPSLLD